MKRQEVTDEMVDRYVTASSLPDFPTEYLKMMARRGLEAALNPPPAAPEAGVTEAMLNAGYDAVTKLDKMWRELDSRQVMAAAYPAMERVRWTEFSTKMFPVKWGNAYLSKIQTAPFYRWDIDGQSPDTRVKERRNGHRRLMDKTTSRPFGCRREPSKNRRIGGAK